MAAYTVMRAQGFGHIVNTASMAGLIAAPGLASYVATKHAVVGISHSLCEEALEEGISVSVLCPGVINTPILQGGKYGKLLTDPPADVDRRAMAPALFAKRAVADIARKRRVIIHPFSWRIVLLMARLFPGLLRLLMRRRR